jgi:glycosyltransferase involved in cell wall biosynthesis
MRILVDLTYILNIEHLNTGIALYAFRLLQNIRKTLRKDITLFIRYPILQYCHENLSGYKKILYKETNNLLNKIPLVRKHFESYSWKRQVNNMDFDCIYVPAGWINNAGKIRQKKIITIHDLGLIRYIPDQYFFFKISFLKHIFFFISKQYFYKSISNCKKVITISEFVKKDILRTFKIKDDTKFCVVYNGIPSMPQETKSIAELINKKFILYVGTLVRYKNIITLLQAYKLIQDTIQEKIVIVGKTTSYWDKECIRIINELHPGCLFHYENISDTELFWLYKNARLFVTTSLCEGFGYTPIEAALSGTEVISTMCDSLPEVTMNLVNYYYPATDYKELAKTIMELLQKEPDNVKLDTIRSEFEKKYNIEKFAENVLSVLYSALE